MSLSINTGDMKHKLILLSGIYLAGVIGFGTLRYLKYADSMEAVQTYVHYYELDFPEETETLLDVNTASETKLASLPGISRPVAAKIVRYRKQRGNFADISELSACMPESLLVQISGLLCCNVAETTEVTEIPAISETESTESLTEVTIPEITTEIITEVVETSIEVQAITESEIITETEELTEIVFPLELNQASIEELCAVPGIGAVTALAVIEYREAIGGFLNCEQLLEVSGIGETRYAQILPYLYLENEYYPEPEAELTEKISETEAITDMTEPPEEILPETLVINLNTATKEELLLLPRCDEALAEEILTLRDREIHIFYNILEIMLAEHVTTELFVEWEPFLTVDDNGNSQIPYLPPEA